jgi:hypothetical protein
MMKGHVGGGSTFDGFKASAAWLSNMPFHLGFLLCGVFLLCVVGISMS